MRETYSVNDTLSNLIDIYGIQGYRSLESLKSRVKPLYKFFEGRLLSSVTTGDLTAYATARIKDGKSTTTINREFALLRRAMHLAKHDNKIPQLPYFPMFRENNVRTGVVTPAQFRYILRHLPTRYVGFVQMAWLTGRRKGELLKIRVGDLGTDGINVPGSNTKNGQVSFIPWTPDLHSVVTTHLKQYAGEELLFDNMAGFDRAWKKACEKAGFPGLLFHDLRRSVASDLVQAGVDIPTAMRVTGHKTISTFLRYNIINNAAVQQAREKLTEYRAKE